MALGERIGRPQFAAFMGENYYELFDWNILVEQQRSAMTFVLTAHFKTGSSVCFLFDLCDGELTIFGFGTVEDVHRFIK